MSFFSQVSNTASMTGLWLYAASLIHFLYGESKPFEYPSVLVRHYDKSGQWWGIKALDNIKQNSKKATIKLVFSSSVTGTFLLVWHACVHSSIVSSFIMAACFLGVANDFDN